MASPRVQQVVELIEGMTVLELVELGKALQDRFGIAPVAVAAAAPAAAAPATAPAEAAAPPPEEKTEFTVVLTEVGPNKINVIKAVREITNLGLKEAKAVVDEAPRPVKEGVSREEAERIAAKLAEAGAKVEIR
jgi:large subunit ribosomal protein L7/L12